MKNESSLRSVAIQILLEYESTIVQRERANELERAMAVSDAEIDEREATPLPAPNPAAIISFGVGCPSIRGVSFASCKICIFSVSSAVSLSTFGV